MTTYTPRAERSRKTYHRRRIFLGLGLVLMAMVVWAGARFYQFWNQPLTVVPEGVDPSSPEVVDAPPVDKNHFTVLLLGADMRSGLGRSDTILLAFVDLEKSAVKLLSFPRDSYVEIPGRGWDKINAAFSDGGSKLVKQTFEEPAAVEPEQYNATFAAGGARVVKKTVENITGVPIDYWVAVDMSGFAEIVDAVGGIDVVIDKDMDYEDPWDNPPLYIHLKAGAQRLMGTDALHFVRFRADARSDWGRMERQQQAIKALVKAALRPANLTRIPQLAKLGLQNVHTNMSPSVASGLVDIAKKTLGGTSIDSVSLTGEDLWAPDDPNDPNAIEHYYTVLDFAKMRETVREMAGLSQDPTVLERDRIATLAYEKAIPFGSADSGGWRQELIGSDVAVGEEEPEDEDSSDEEESPPKKEGQTPADDDGQTPPDEGGETPPDEGGETPPDEGGETPPDDGGETPPDDGGQPPPVDGGQTAPGGGRGAG